MTEQFAANAASLPTVALEDVGQVAYNSAVQALEDEIVSELTLSVMDEGFGRDESASRKFVRTLLRDPEAFAEFIDNNANVNLDDPLEDGEYAD